MGRIVALDYGRARIGVAISDPSQMIAQPAGVILHKKTVLADLKKFLDSWKPIDKIVLGLPLELSGKEGPMAQEVRLFAKQIQEALEIAVILLDERLTTAQIEKTLREGSLSRKERASKVDTLSATLLLQIFLETKSYIPK